MGSEAVTFRDSGTYSTIYVDRDALLPTPSIFAVGCFSVSRTHIDTHKFAHHREQWRISFSVEAVRNKYSQYEEAVVLLC